MAVPSVLAFVVAEFRGQAVAAGARDVQSLLSRGRVSSGGGKGTAHGGLVGGYEVVAGGSQFEFGLVGAGAGEGKGRLVKRLEADGTLRGERRSSRVFELGNEVSAFGTDACLRSVRARPRVAIRFEGLVI